MITQMLTIITLNIQTLITKKIKIEYEIVPFSVLIKLKVWTFDNSL